MLKYLLMSLVLSLPLTVATTQAVDAGLFGNRPVRSFFQNRRPVRRILKGVARVATAPVRAVRRGRAQSCSTCASPSVTSTSVSSSNCANCGTEG